VRPYQEVCAAETGSSSDGMNDTLR
jgi:hypothetical protein